MLDRNVLVLWTTISFLTSFLGAIGNLWFSFVIKKHLWKKINYRILFWITIVDFLCDIFFIPTEILQTYWKFTFEVLLGSKIFCQILSIFYYVCSMGSTLGKFIAALFRGWSIFFPIYFRSWVTLRFTNFVIAVMIFGFTSVVHLGLFVWGMDYDIDKVFGDCYSIFVFKWVDIFRSVIFIYFPVFASLIIYFTIFMKLLFLKSHEKDSMFKLSRGSGALFCSIAIYGSFNLILFISKNFYSQTHFTQISVSIWKKFLFKLSYAINPVRFSIVDIFKIIRKNVLIL